MEAITTASSNRTTMKTSKSTSAKRVRWSTITIHEFGVGHGGSAVPNTGPSIGLARRPEFTWSTSVGTMARECDGVRRFTSAERAALLRDAGFSSERIETFVDEAADVRDSRELYYSREMKSFRKKRKRCKADARNKRARCKGTAPTATPVVLQLPLPSTNGNDSAAAAVEDKVTIAEQLRIQIHPLAAGSGSSSSSLPPSTSNNNSDDAKILVPASPSLLLQPLPLSPCCS